MCETNGAFDPQYTFTPTCAHARFAELLARAQNTIMCLNIYLRFLASGLDLGLSEMVETRDQTIFGRLRMLPRWLKAKANEMSSESKIEKRKIRNET